MSLSLFRSGSALIVSLRASGYLADHANDYWTSTKNVFLCGNCGFSPTGFSKPELGKCALRQRKHKI